ncbi:MAG: hypothetical protein QXF69_04605 [Thermofilaceae archaeon]
MSRTAVVSVKVPREMKEKMEGYAGVVNWAEGSGNGLLRGLRSWRGLERWRKL